jgi:hypothetical protein
MSEKMMRRNEMEGRFRGIRDVEEIGGVTWRKEGIVKEK